MSYKAPLKTPAHRHVRRKLMALSHSEFWARLSAKMLEIKHEREVYKQEFERRATADLAGLQAAIDEALASPATTAIEKETTQNL